MGVQGVPEIYSFSFQPYQERPNLFAVCAPADTEQKYARPTGFIRESLVVVSIPFNHLSSRTLALEEINKVFIFASGTLK